MENNDIISKELLDILVCPLCKTEIEMVEYKTEHHGLKCNQCQRIYPIRNGIPVMLKEEAILP